jgi:hypothetical protein
LHHAGASAAAALHLFELTPFAKQPLLTLRHELPRFRRQRLLELIALPGAKIHHLFTLLFAKLLNRLALLLCKNLTAPSGRRRRHRRLPAAALRLTHRRYCREHRRREQPSSAVHFVSSVRAPSGSRRR